MKLIAGSRGTGKTTRLIQIAAKNNYLLACVNKQMSAYAWNMSKELGLDIIYPITHEQLLLGDVLLGLFCEGILIDDVDRFIGKSLNTAISIKAVSMSTDDLEVRVLDPHFSDSTFIVQG